MNHLIPCSFCTDKTNPKPVKENPLTSKDNFVVFQSALPCLIPPTNMSQAYLLNGVTENVPDIDNIYFIRSYFACRRRSYTYSARNITSEALVKIIRDNQQLHWHHPRFRFGIFKKQICFLKRNDTQVVPLQRIPYGLTTILSFRACRGIFKILRLRSG